MEQSKRTTTRTGHLSSSTKNKQKPKKVSPSDRKFVVQQYIKSLLVHYDPNVVLIRVVFIAKMEQ